MLVVAKFMSREGMPRKDQVKRTDQEKIRLRDYQVERGPLTPDAPD